MKCGLEISPSRKHFLIVSSSVSVCKAGDGRVCWMERAKTAETEKGEVAEQTDRVGKSQVAVRGMGLCKE